MESIEGEMDARMDNWNKKKKEHRQLVPAVVSSGESNGKQTSGKPRNISGESLGAAKQNSSVISQDSGKKSLKPTHPEWMIDETFRQLLKQLIPRRVEQDDRSKLIVFQIRQELIEQY